MTRHLEFDQLLAEENRLREKGHYAGALSILDQLIALDDSYSPAYNNKGAILLKFHRYNQALPILEKAVTLDPNNGVAWNNYAYCHHATGYPEKAIPLYRRALEKGYTHEGVNYNLGYALLAIGNRDEAIQQWKIASQKNPNYDAPFNALYQLAKTEGVITLDIVLSPRLRLKRDYLALYEQLSPKSIDLQNLDGTNKDLEQRLELLLQASATLKYDPLPTIFVGIFPIRSLNAQAVKVESGFLLLVNEGLMLSALQISIIVASLASVESKGEVLPTDIDIDQAKKLFKDWVLALITEETKTQLDFRLVSARRYDLAHGLFATLVDFVIAHELSHVLSRHFDDVIAFHPDQVNKHIEAYTHSWQQEFEADQVAIELVKRIYHDQVPEESMYLGAALFFELTEAIADMSTGFRDQLGLRLHPPAAARRSNLITSTHSKLYQAQLPFVDHILDIVSQLRTESSDTQSLPRQDQIERLQEYSKACDVKKLTELMRLGKANKGVTEFNFYEIIEYMKINHDRARSMVALTAIGYLTTGKSTNYIYGFHLSLLATIYLGAFSNDPVYGGECKDFFDLLRTCISDLDQLMIEFYDKLREQHSETGRDLPIMMSVDQYNKLRNQFPDLPKIDKFS